MHEMQEENEPATANSTEFVANDKGLFDKNFKQASTKEEEYNGKAVKLLNKWIHNEKSLKADVSIEVQQKEIVTFYGEITKKYVEEKQEKIRQIKKQLLDKQDEAAK